MNKLYRRNSLIPLFTIYFPLIRFAYFCLFLLQKIHGRIDGMAKHILIADDELDITHILEDYLVSHGFSVTVTHSGAEAVRIAKACYPDLLMLDLRLPDMQGEAVCQEIKHSYDLKLRNIPILILSAKTTDVDHVFCTVIGASAYLEKPFHPSNVLETIQRILSSTI